MNDIFSSVSVLPIVLLSMIFGVDLVVEIQRVKMQFSRTHQGCTIVESRGNEPLSPGSDITKTCFGFHAEFFSRYAW